MTAIEFANQHAASLIEALGAASALQIAEDYQALGTYAAHGPEHWRLVVAAIKRTVARSLTEQQRETN